MLTIAGNTRIFIYKNRVDMRKSFEGLGAVVEREYPDKLLTGSLFVFLNRTGDRIKTLYWDHDGLAIWYKRLEKGSFSSKNYGEIDRRKFFMMLEGVTPKSLQKRWIS